MIEFRINKVLGSEALLKKFNSDIIRNTLASDHHITHALQNNTGVVLICKETLGRLNNDSWVKKGWAYHTIILPYEAVMAMSDAEANQLAIQYIAERFRQLIAKKHKTVLPLQVVEGNVI